MTGIYFCANGDCENCHNFDKYSRGDALMKFTENQGEPNTDCDDINALKELKTRRDTKFIEKIKDVNYSELYK